MGGWEWRVVVAWTISVGKLTVGSREEVKILQWISSLSAPQGSEVQPSGVG